MTATPSRRQVARAVIGMQGRGRNIAGQIPDSEDVDALVRGSHHIVATDRKAAARTAARKRQRMARRKNRR